MAETIQAFNTLTWPAAIAVSVVACCIAFVAYSWINWMRGL